MERRIKLIANPVAGGDARRKIRLAQARLEHRGCRVDLILTAARGDAEAAAREAGKGRFDRIIAAGGDGTLNEVVNGLAPSSIPLAFLPLGTTNVFALEAGIPFDVEKACDVALDGKPQPVCLGAADGVRFLLMAGVGFDAEVVYRVSARLKRWTGKFAYLAGAVATLLGPPPPLLEVEDEDGTLFRAYSVVIGNGRLYGGRFSLTPDASMTEARLDVCLFRRWGRGRILRHAARVAAGARLEEPEVGHFKTRRLTVRGAAAPVQVDGDFLGRLPMTFRAVSGEIVMVLPRED